MQKCDPLADGRAVYRLPFENAERRIAPGQWLQQQAQCWPVMKIESSALWLIAGDDRAPADAAIAGEPLPPPEQLTLGGQGPLLLSSWNDGLFALLAWLFRHRRQLPPERLRVYAGFDRMLPLRPQPSRFLTPDLPAQVTAAIPLLDDWGIVSRLYHPDGLPGCHDDRAGWQRLLAGAVLRADPPG